MLKNKAWVEEVLFHRLRWKSIVTAHLKTHTGSERKNAINFSHRY